MNLVKHHKNSKKLHSVPKEAFKFMEELNIVPDCDQKCDQMKTPEKKCLQSQMSRSAC